MSFNHAIRISLPYEDLSGIISGWATRCSRIVAYQHEADEQVSATHVHLALYNCEVKTEALKRMWTSKPNELSGNSFWSMKDADAYDTSGCLTYLGYMINGSASKLPVFNKNVEQEVLDTASSVWVVPGSPDTTAEGTERIVRIVVRKITDKYSFRNDIDSIYCRQSLEKFKNSFETELTEGPISLPCLLQHCRYTAYSEMFRATQRAPHASHYKIVASTAYSRICQRWSTDGSRWIINLWY